MLYVSAIKKRALCVFPRNHCEVKNIEVGSDSEEYCLLISISILEKWFTASEEICGINKSVHDFIVISTQTIFYKIPLNQNQP